MECKILVSACLVGKRVRYDGSVAPVNDQLRKLHADGRVVLFCPEVEGGLSVPRPPAEIQGGDGRDVLKKKAVLVCEDGGDVTSCFITGAVKALRLAGDHDIRFAVMKEGSPSCGSSYVYDGSFTKTRKTGKGVTVALLEKYGIQVYSEYKIEAMLDDFRGKARI